MRIILEIFITGLIITFFCIEISAKQYKGAELRTYETFTYGRFEISYIPAKREGVVSSFFTYHEISNVNEWNEIDFEFIGRYDNQIQVNIISPGQRNHEASIPLDFNPYEDFHTYAFEWTPDYVAWFIDGEEIYRQTEAHVAEINRDQKIMMNIWPPNYVDWVGKIDPDNLPAYAHYDWVSYSSYTPGSGNTGTGNNFTFQWRDDFDSFNSERWGRGTHTWTGNESDFVIENVVFRDGIMTLCLTKEGETGIVDNQPPKVLWVKETSRNEVIIRFGEEVEKTSAENIANYLIPGATVTKAVLSADKTIVTLNTQNYDPDATYNVIILNIKDDTGENTLSQSAKTIKQLGTLEFPVKINVGGDAFEDYLPDQEWQPSLDYGHMDGTPTLYPGNLLINNTDKPEIFRSERYRIVTYRIAAPRGIYNVKLLCAENYYDEPLKRVFDITIENEKILDDFDIFAEVGKNTAYEIESEIFVDDDMIDISLTNEIDYGLLNGIEIEQVTTDIDEDEDEIINKTFRLNQNYPNPFNPTTTIEYYLSRKSFTTLKIYDALGEEVRTIVNELKQAGLHKETLTVDGLSSGVYFYRLSVDGILSKTKKMVYLK